VPALQEEPGDDSRDQGGGEGDKSKIHVKIVSKALVATNTTGVP
jgi:hypothetical protein